MTLSRRALIAVSLALSVGPVGQPVTRAQDAVSELEQLHNELSNAQAEIGRIQGQARSVEDQIASIDKEAAAVQRALDAAKALMENIQAEIGLIEAQLAEEQRVFERVRAEARGVATSLYKSGSAAEIEMLLSARSLADIDAILEYATAANASKVEVMVSFARLKARVDEAKAALEVKLAEARETRDEELKFSQHLGELRHAQRLKLAKLRRTIRGVQQEADAIEAESARIASRLASPTSAIASSGVSVGGFAWPFGGAVTSGYGERWGRMHQGIDIDCVTGNTITASKSGQVVSATYDSGYGNYLVIDHGGGYATLYAHNTELFVDSGESVSQGQAISSCGATGAVTGDHLHFEVRVNGAPQDPLRYLP